jgi:hypothetical protein
VGSWIVQKRQWVLSNSYRPVYPLRRSTWRKYGFVIDSHEDLVVVLSRCNKGGIVYKETTTFWKPVPILTKKSDIPPTVLEAIFDVLDGRTKTGRLSTIQK